MSRAVVPDLGLVYEDLDFAENQGWSNYAYELGDTPDTIIVTIFNEGDGTVKGRARMLITFVDKVEEEPE